MIEPNRAPRIAVVGHRGARAWRPENTLPAFQCAIAEGVDALELDIVVTKDDIVVVSHDPVLAGGLIRQITFAQLGETTIPSLDEVLRLAPLGSFDFFIELKSFPDHDDYAPAPEEFARMTLAMVRAHGLDARVIVQSFDFRTLIAMRSLAPEIRLAALIEDDERDFAAVSTAAAHAEIVAPHFHLVTPEKVAAAHRAQIEVISWTANSSSEWDVLVSSEIDGIISDDPAALISYLSGIGLRPAHAPRGAG